MGSYEYIKFIFNRLLSVVTDVDYRRILEMFFGSGGALDPAAKLSYKFIRLFKLSIR